MVPGIQRVRLRATEKRGLSHGGPLENVGEVPGVLQDRLKAELRTACHSGSYMNALSSNGRTQTLRNRTGLS